jgi:DNA-binding IclR family transcriptional regulator
LVLKIAMILDVLSDGKWHSISELTEKLRLSGYEVEPRLEFLNEFELAKFDVEDGKIRINKDFKKLLDSSTV